MILNGFKLYVDPPREVRVKRTWKKRLFSTPWRPLLTHNTRLEEVLNDGQVVQMGDSLVMNQKTFNKVVADLTATAKARGEV